MNMHANSRFNVLPWPFRLWWLQPITEMEGVPLNMADIHNVYTNYMKSLTRDAIYENINGGILDVAGNFNYTVMQITWLLILDDKNELHYSQLLKIDSLWINAIVWSLMMEIVIYPPKIDLN